ncbi:MAG: Na-translocating system protein MpsB [Firmicutes bacterium]|nr:Na-translocating system protein MpsB [Bacillota bacterium]
MENLHATIQSQSLRESARAALEAARRVVAPLGPVDAYAAMNPLSGFTDTPFGEAVKMGQLLLGGEGYLPASEYRRWYRAGRITDGDLEEAIRHLRPPDPPLSLRRYGSPQEIIRRVLVGDERPLPESWRRALDAHLLPRSGAGDAGAWRQEAVGWLHALGEPGETMAQWVGRLIGRDLAGALNQALVPWLSAFFAQHEVASAMPYRDQGFYVAWCRLHRSSRTLGPLVALLPFDPLAALAELLTLLGVPEHLWPQYLASHLGQLRGWAGWIRWGEVRRFGGSSALPRMTLGEYLAVRLAYEVALTSRAARRAFGVPGRFDCLREYWEGHLAEFYVRSVTVGKGLRRFGRPRGGDWELHARRLYASRQAALRERELTTLYHLADVLTLSVEEVQKVNPLELREWISWATRFSTNQRQALWQEALERHWQNALLRQWEEAPDPSAPSAARPISLIFCMDPRSEGLRRHLEDLGRYRTIGMAGFFGLAMTVRDESRGRETYQGPPVACPNVTVWRMKNASGQCGGSALVSMYHHLKGSWLSSLVLVESAGWLWGGYAILRTWAPRLLKGFDQRRHQSPGDDTMLVDLSFERAADLVASALKSLGDVEALGPLVVWMGHGSHTTNNPWASTLQCGAAGGHSSGLNARMLATLCNQSAIRRILSQRGFAIPDETWFLGGEHNTTTDEVTLYDVDQVPETHRRLVQGLWEDLKMAGRQHARERWEHLGACSTGTRRHRPRADGLREVELRSQAWAETRPEWGLSGHAALVIGRRVWTRHLKGDDRLFLYTYDYRRDPHGQWLSEIFQGPLAVAHHINMAYYFSAVDNAHYGGGSKVVANVVGHFGVMSGKQSDLKTGLPWQSVRDAQGRLVHEPMRLFVVVEAPWKRVAETLDRQPSVRDWVKNAWIHMTVYDPEQGRWRRMGEGRGEASAPGHKIRYDGKEPPRDA